VLAPGRYVARLRARTLGRGGSGRRRARVSQASEVEVVAPTVSAASGVFPVGGPYTLGGDEARFGAGRSGHSHQGHDIFATEGTPVVAPRAGFIHWRAYQAEGAGLYLVLRGDDGRDYVFMHLRNGSVLVDKGGRVNAGQQLADVGETGRASGPHLHFEIWPDGWYAGDGSAPIDPLPDLLVWADG
jgi:murein DD-endopeptidase MepM/ murein hydrolase activator NlpD